MKRLILTGIIALAISAAAPSFGQPVAGSTTLGVSVAELEAVVNGWSAKKTLIGKQVYNDHNEKIGKLEDVIITTDNKVSYAIVNVGGFLKMGQHLVAIPMTQLKIDKTIILPGATREELKKMPEFKYAPKAK